MATTTTNFGWDIPQSTDLVKDGATAIAALGQDIDTALVDLKGGTTGQVLAKTSGTDLDFSWVAQDDSNAIQNAIVDAKGDLISATAADTPARLAVGANDTVLTADSSTATGLKWAAPAAGGGMTLLSTTTASGSSTSVSVTPTGYNELVIVVFGITLTTDGDLFLRINNDSTASNYNQHVRGVVTATSSIIATNSIAGCAATIPTVAGYPPTGGSNIAQFNIPQPNSTDRKLITSNASFRASGSVNAAANSVCNHTSTAAISSIQAFTTAGSFNGGTILVYGVK